MNAVLLALVMVGMVSATPFGVPETACADMRPGELLPGIGHGGEPQTGAFPYTFTFKSNEEEGDYTITLTANEGESFKGFFLRATDPDTNLAAGIFYEEEENPATQALSCTGISDSVCHTEDSAKTSVTVRWFGAFEPTFYATVLKDKDTYWVTKTATKL